MTGGMEVEGEGEGHQRASSWLRDDKLPRKLSESPACACMVSTRASSSSNLWSPTHAHNRKRNGGLAAWTGGSNGGVLRVRCALLLELLEERAVVVERLLGSILPAQGRGLEVTKWCGG